MTRGFTPVFLPSGRLRGADDSMKAMYAIKFKCRKCESKRTALIPDTFTVEQLLTKLSHVAKTECQVCGEEPYDNWLFVGVEKIR